MLIGKYLGNLGRSYSHHAGRFTINALNILGNLGNPAVDRLFLNLVNEARSDATPRSAVAGELRRRDSLARHRG
jgi:hypothetical protein